MLLTLKANSEHNVRAVNVEQAKTSRTSRSVRTCLIFEELSQLGGFMKHEALRCEHWRAVRRASSTAQQLALLVRSLQPVQVGCDFQAAPYPLVQLSIGSLPT